MFHSLFNKHGKELDELKLRLQQLEVQFNLQQEQIRILQEENQLHMRAFLEINSIFRLLIPSNPSANAAPEEVK